MPTECVPLGVLGAAGRSLQEGAGQTASRSDIVLNEGEVNIGGDRDVEGSLLVGFVGGGHDDVAIGVSIEPQLLRVEAPRHELQVLLINRVVFCWLNVSRVYIETDHGSNESHSDLFLPGLFRSAECNLDESLVACHKFEEELRVLEPGHSVLFLLKLLVVEMAATRATLLPLGCEHDVTAVGQLLHLNWLGRVNYKNNRRQAAAVVR